MGGGGGGGRGGVGWHGGADGGGGVAWGRKCEGLNLSKTELEAVDCRYNFMPVALPCAQTPQRSDRAGPI